MDWIYSDCFSSYIIESEFLKNYLGITQLDLYLDTKIDTIEGYYFNNSFYEDVNHENIIEPNIGTIYKDITNDNQLTYSWKNNTYNLIANTPQAFFPYQVQILKYINKHLITLGLGNIKDKVQAILDLLDDGLTMICKLKGKELAEKYGVEVDSIEYEQDRFIAAWTYHTI